jgi:chromosome segregation ATPase
MQNANEMKLENLSNTLKARDKQLNELIFRESEMTRVIDELSNKTKAISNEKEDMHNELLLRANELNNVKIKNDFLETTLMEKVKTCNDLEESRRILQTELKDTLRSMNEYKQKHEKVTYLIIQILNELNKEIKDNFDLKNTINSTSLKLDKYEKENSLLQDNIDNLEADKRFLIDEKEKIRNLLKDSEAITNNLRQNLNEYYKYFQSLCSFNKTYTQKLITFVQSSNDLNTNFSNTIYSLERDVSNEKKPSEVFKLVQELVRILSNEIEILYDKTSSKDEELKNCIYQIKQLELNIHDLTITNDDKTANERKMNHHINSLLEEIDMLSTDKNTLESEIDKLTQDLRKCQTEHQRILGENSSLKDELRKIQHYCDNVVKDNLANYNSIETNNFQIETLEERISIIAKENKYLESLIEKLSRSHPVPGVLQLMNDILNNINSLSKCEREKAKLENSLAKLDTEWRDHKIENSEMRKEKDRLKQLIYGIDKDISKLC